MKIASPRCSRHRAVTEFNTAMCIFINQEKRQSKRHDGSFLIQILQLNIHSITASKLRSRDTETARMKLMFWSQEGSLFYKTTVKSPCCWSARTYLGVLVAIAVQQKRVISIFSNEDESSVEVAQISDFYDYSEATLSKLIRNSFTMVIGG